jgi:hypothetical protein
MCDQSCKSCSGPTALDCIECKSALLVQLDKSCKSGCPSNSFIANNVRCERCFTTCKDCSGPNDVDCGNCIDGFIKLPNSKCDSQLPPRHFLNNANEAQPCHSTCQTCDGETSSNCLSCTSPEIFRRNKENKCIDCTLAHLENKETCSYVVELRLSEAGANCLKPKASHTAKLTFPGEDKHKTALTVEILKTSLKLEIEGLKDSEYSLVLERREGQILVDFYSSVSKAEKVTLVVTPIKQNVLIDPTTGLVSLYFLNKPATMQIPVKESPNAAMMESLENLTASSEQSMSSVSGVAALLAAFAVLASSPILAPLIKFLKIFKLVSRLKLINIYYGAYLEFVLMIAGMMFNIGNDPQTPQLAKFSVMTRGQLTKFKVTTISIEPLWVKYMVYYVIVLVRLYQAKIRQYVKRRLLFSFDDRVMDLIADQSRIVIFTMIVIDILFYSTHCLTHMDRQIPQTRDSTISFILSMITVVVISIDVLLLYISNKNLNVTRILTDRKVALIKEKNDRIRKNRLERGPLAVKEGPANPEQEEPKENKGGVLDEEINGQKEENKEEGLKKEKGVKLLKLKRHQESSSYAAECFFTEGIKSESLNDARYFNTNSLIKLILVEPIYVTLQMMPTVQILILFAIQAGYFGYFINIAFRKKALASKIEIAQIFINELAILLFICIGFLFQLAGGVGNLSTELSTYCQIVGIIALGISCLVGSVTMLFSMAKSAYRIVKGIINARNKKKYQEIYNKEEVAKPKAIKPKEEAVKADIQKPLEEAIGLQERTGKLHRKKVVVAATDCKQVLSKKRKNNTEDRGLLLESPEKPLERKALSPDLPQPEKVVSEVLSSLSIHEVKKKPMRKRTKKIMLLK